jgi:hypothetical protein
MTSITYTFSSGNYDFQVPFPFISEAHLNVYLAGSTVASNQWDLVNGNTVHVDTTLVEGDTVFIERVTPVNTALVDFTSNTGIRERELDTAFNQILFALQELDVEATGGLRKNGPGNAWDGKSLPLKSLGAPTDLADAATKGYVDANLASTGTLPIPGSGDIGLGLRVRADGANIAYEIAQVDGAVASFKMMPGTAANLNAQPVVTNSYGTAWTTQTAAEIPLILESSHDTPEVGPLEVQGNRVVVPAGGVFEVEATLRFRNRIDGTTTNILSVDAAIVDENDNILDKTPGNYSGLTTLGAGGGCTDPPVSSGLPSFPWVGSTTVKLYAIVDAGASNLSVFLRAVTDGNTNEVFLDEGSRIVFRELSQ